MIATVGHTVETVDWTGIAGFLTALATLLGVLFTARQNRGTKQTLDNVAPRVVELHDEALPQSPLSHPRAEETR